MSKENPIMILVNPSAGRTTSNTALGSAVNAFCSAGYNPTIYYTTGAGSAAEIARSHGGKYSKIICLGGDGTLSDTIGGLMALNKEERPVIGYIPMGTANDVATTLGLPMRQPLKAAEIVLEGQVQPYDVGEMIGIGYFSYIAAFGAFTEVSYKTNQELKHVLGHAAYVVEGLSALPTIKGIKAKIEYDTGTMEDEFIYGAVSNAMSVGGVMKMREDDVNLSDGQFELLVVRKPSQPGDVNQILGSILRQDYTTASVTLIHSSHIKVEFDEDVAWTRDGEDGGKHREIEFRCHPRAVEILH